jgi:predicted AlkP superfamily phosphohydrolase/phosphomutase
MKPKILVIGLDAATMDLIDPWIAAGYLPALENLMKEGASARLISTPNMHSASAWTSILTGLNPGKHGLFVFSDRDYATGRLAFFKGGDRTGDTVASHLSRYGLTAGFLNVPMTYPADEIKGGFMISGLDAPALNENAFRPAELRAEIFERFADYNFAPEGLGDLMKSGRVSDAVDAWLKLIEIQTAAAEYMIQSYPVDFFMTVYTASDWAGHNLWKHKDVISTAEPKSASLDNAMLNIYRALDSAISRLLKHADEQTHIYIISDHGMGPHTGASYHLAEWLEQRGYMVRRSSNQTRASLIDAGRQIAKLVLPASVKEKIKSKIGDERVRQLQNTEKDTFYSSIDWSRTTAYTEPGRHVININLAGRNLDGVVSNADYEKTCRRIIEELLEWKDSKGRGVVERVALRDEVYSGPYAQRASDMYIHWNPEASMGEPPAEVRARGFWWSGDHRPEGILICKGPGIRQGTIADAPKVYDLVPTLMYLSNLSVPAGLDGKVIEQVCDEALLASRPIQIDTAAQAALGDQSKLSEEEEKVIEEKLRALGYM